MRLLVGFALVAAAWGGSFEERWREITAHASNDELYRLLWAAPKGGDLHNHHEYSVPMQFWLESAARRGYLTRVRPGPCGPGQWTMLRAAPDCARSDFKPARELSPVERRQWLRAMTLDAGETRDEFFERIVERLGDLERDAELMADALDVQRAQMADENALYLETQADPRGFAGMSADAGAQVLRTRLKSSAPVAVRMQVSTLRFGERAESDLADGFAFVHRNHDLWKAVNLVGREDNPAGTPSRFVGTLGRLRAQYPDVALSLHAGESASRDHHVAETIALGAARIGHGINAEFDPEAMRLLESGKYLVEINLVSNWLLGYVNDLRKHPLPRYLKAGIPVCLNTDDRGIYGSNLTDDYFAAVALAQVSWADLVRMGRWSLEFSFAEPELKHELIKRYEANVAAFEQRFSGDWRAELRRVAAKRSAVAPRLFALRRF